MQGTNNEAVRLDGRVAIITGAGNGLGREHAKALAARGASVLVNDLGTDPHGNELDGGSPAQAVVEEIRASGGKAVACHASCATREGGDAIVQSALDAFGGLDVLVHNAGFLRNAPFEDLTDSDIRSLVDVHLMGAFYVGQPAYRIMKEKRYGRIILTSSSAGMFGSLWQTNYGAAKAGLFGLMNNIAQEGAKYGITANTVLPGGFTRLGRSGTKEWPDDFLDHAPKGWEPLISPEGSREFVAALVVWLASENCKATQQVYSAVGQRYARAFVGLTPGWYSDKANDATPEDIQRHAAEIDDTSRFGLPKSMFDEFRYILENSAARVKT